MIGAIGLMVSNNAGIAKPTHPRDLVLVLSFLGLPAVGCLLVWHRSRSTIGRLLLAMGLCGTLYLLAFAWAVFALRTRGGHPPLGTFAAWVASFLAVPSLGIGLWIAALFPTERIMTPWLRRSSPFAMLALGILTIAQALSPEPIDGVDPFLRQIENPLGVERLAALFSPVSAATVFVLIVFGLGSLADLAWRFRRAVGETRQQIRWVATSLALLPLSFLTMLVGQSIGGWRLAEMFLLSGQALFLVALSGALSVAVLRYRLFELDAVVRRSVSYVVLSGGLAILYLIVVGSIGAVFTTTAEGPKAAVAGAVVAMALAPARVRIQRLVDRLSGGARVEPYRVLSALGHRLDQATDPDEILRFTATTIAETLNLAYVGIELIGDGGSSGGVVAAVGQSGGRSRRFPVLHHGELLGYLVVRRQGSVPHVDNEVHAGGLSGSDDVLLGELALQAGRAVAAARLRIELRDSRAKLVLGREDERLRLRRDLHDGLGPTLAGMTLRVDAMSAARTPALAAAHLAALKRDLGQATSEVRRIARAVRPAALDELGLGEALRQQAIRLSAVDGAPEIEIVLPVVMKPLPAAIEVAVLRIAGEAMTNVVRHAGARICRLLLTVDDELRLEVTDDGSGIPAGVSTGKHDGVGLASMRARAEELGGRLEIRSRTAFDAAERNGSRRVHGTVLAATIPLGTT